jgi:hypothetical protein
MTTLESPESLPTRSETKSDSLPLPILDLINIQTLSEDIAADPGGREAKRFAGQILEDCGESDGLADVRDLAEQIRASSSPDEREALAVEIVEQIERLLESAEAAAPVSVAV